MKRFGVGVSIITVCVVIIVGIMVFYFEAEKSNGVKNPSTTTTTTTTQTPPAQNPPTASSVQVNTITPNNGGIGDQVVISGSGFVATNTVLFDNSVAVKNVTMSSFTNGGQTLTITVPSSLSPNCDATSGQPCPTYTIAVTPGTYEVSVQNKNGTSNSIPFTINQ